MGIETLALSGIHGMKLDDRYRILFPASFRDEIVREIGSDYYLLLRPKTIDVSRVLRIEPMLRKAYDKKAQEMNSKDEDAPERIDFFKQMCTSLDDQGRLTLTSFLSKIMGYQRGEKHYFVGRGNFCELYKLNFDEITDLMLKDEEVI